MELTKLVIGDDIEVRILICSKARSLPLLKLKKNFLLIFLVAILAEEYF